MATPDCFGSLSTRLKNLLNDKIKSYGEGDETTQKLRAVRELQDEHLNRLEIIHNTLAEKEGKPIPFPKIENKGAAPVSENDFSKMSDADVEKRMGEIDDANLNWAGTKEGKEYDALEKEMERRERATVFNVPLDKVSDAVDALLTKEKERPNGYGSFIEKRDASETKQVAEKYLNPKEISDADLKKDFKDALLGNPDTWYADGLQLREAAKESANRGIPIEDLLKEATDIYVRDGYDLQTAKEVVASKLKPIFDGSQKVNEKQLKPATVKDNTAEPTENKAAVIMPNEAADIQNKEVISPEGNPPSEPPTQESVPTEEEGKNVGVSHKSLSDLSKKLGLAQPERGDYIEPQQYAERGRELLKNGASIEDVNNTNNDLHDRISIARAHLEDLYSAADKAEKEHGVKSKEYKDAVNEVEKYVNDTVKKLGTLAHRAFVSLQGERDLDTGSFTKVKKAFEDNKGSKATPEQEQKIQSLTRDNEILKKRAKEAQEKLIKTTDESIGTSKDTPKGKYSEVAKKAADTFRKLKTKPFIFMDSNGNEIKIHTQGVTWNDAVEFGAKVIEKTGQIADGVAEVINRIKDTDWYKKFSDDDKKKFEKDLTAHYKNAIEDTPEAKNIRRLEKQLEDLRQGKIPNKGDRRELSEVEKNLQDQIVRAKQDLGLLSSKKNISEKEPISVIEDTPEEKRIKVLEKQRDDLLAGKIKNKDGKPEYNFTESETKKVKDLEDEIDALKKKSGLAKGKLEKPLTEQEKIEAAKKRVENLQKIFADKTGNKFTPEESTELWDYAKSEYLNKGVQYRDMISYVSNDTGLSWKQVYEAINTPKTKPISDVMWRKQADLRLAQIKTKDFVQKANKNIFGRALDAITGLPRATAVFGHGGIFVGTHAGMTLFDAPRAKYTIKALFNAYKFAYGNTAKYERAMAELKSRPNYTIAERAGLQNNPNEVNNDAYLQGQKYITKFFKKLGMSGIKGFNAIKVLRQDLFDSHYNSLSAAEKADPAVAKEIAHLVNNATGGTNIDLKIRDKQGNVKVDPDKIFFAAGMEAARWEKLTSNPTKATSVAIKSILHPSEATPAEKVFAKVWAKRVGWELATYAGVLTANAGLQSLLNPTNPVNLTNPFKPDFLKFKVGEETNVDMSSGMIGALGFISGIIHAGTEDQKDLHGDTRVQAMGKKGIQYLRGKLSPALGIVADLATQTDYSGNPLPFSDDKPKKYAHKLTWGEYAWEKAPIPIADAAKSMYDGMIENGMTKPQANTWLDGLVKFLEAGTTGFRISEYKQNGKGSGGGGGANGKAIPNNNSTPINNNYGKPIRQVAEPVK